jgi:hypothetical protein
MNPTAGTPCGKFMCEQEVVHDAFTHLTWQRAVPDSYAGCSVAYEVGVSLEKGAPGDACLWQEALAYCSRLKVASGGWRLPSKNELLSIVDHDHGQPTIDLTIFPNTRIRHYWTSTTEGVAEGYGWYVDFGNGNPNTTSMDLGLNVRCVR